VETALLDAHGKRLGLPISAISSWLTQPERPTTAARTAASLSFMISPSNDGGMKQIAKKLSRRI
jgi:hypothetical protein